jgi:hypothetical protein
MEMAGEHVPRRLAELESLHIEYRKLISSFKNLGIAVDDLTCFRDDTIKGTMDLSIP